MIRPMLMCMTIEIGRQQRTAEIIDSLLQKFIQSTSRERPRVLQYIGRQKFDSKGIFFYQTQKEYNYSFEKENKTHYRLEQ